MTEIDASFPSRVQSKAEKIFRKGHFFCSEAVLRALLDESGMQAHRDMVALASGFSTGMGGAGCSCGAVIGGIMGLGVFFGRSIPRDPAVCTCMDFAHELHDTFRRKHHSICCRVLSKGVAHGSSEQQENCAQRTGDAAEMAARILLREWQKRQL